MISLKFLNRNLMKRHFCRFLSTQNSVINVSVNRNENAVTFDDFKSLVTNKKIEYKMKIILNEYELYRNSDEDRDRVPTRLTLSQMRQLLDCHQVVRKKRQWIDSTHKQRKHLLYLMRRCEDCGDKQLIITPLMSIEFEKLYSNRLKNASLFGQNVVFDLSFDDYMSIMECKNLAEQIYRIYKFNKYECLKYSSGELPFNLNLCNVDRSGRTFKFVEFLYPELISDKSFVNITSKSYLDIFTKQDLVYLSPHADQLMTEYDDSAVFIIGGIVDRKEVLPLSQPKAKEQNIRSVRLPIDALVTPKTNIQSLDSVFRVLFDFKAFGVNNENIGFEDRIRRHIPEFKLKSVAQTTYEKLRNKELSEELSLDFDHDFETNSDFK